MEGIGLNIIVIQGSGIDLIIKGNRFKLNISIIIFNLEENDYY